MIFRLAQMTALAAALVFFRRAAPAQTFNGSAALDEVIEQGIKDNQIPGAVLLVAHKGQILHRKAYGARALVPAQEEMTLDTIFDAASLTKVVATTSAILKLVENGKVRLNDRVTTYLPEFQDGKSEITIRLLMTHFSGLRPDLDLLPAWSGYETGIRKALVDIPVAQPGERFIYSDINFILLGEIVRKVSGRPLDEFVRDKVFAPLGMNETMFRPPAELRPRIAPTEWLKGDEAPLRGVVHDETTRYMGGVAGHAGLFTTADDLLKFAEMMLGMGERKGVRIFSPLGVRKFTSPASPADQPILRGLGWDVDSPFSGNRGDLFPIGSYGHTGFTGTSLWIDPATQTVVILLSNGVHPTRRPATTPLRGRIATVTAAALGIDAPGVAITGYNETLAGAGVHRAVARMAEVLTGLDVLAAQEFAPLAGKRVGLITNQTGLARDGRRNLDLMLAARAKVTALFSPEHGIAGKLDQARIASTKDAKTKIPVYSLYSGKNRRPTSQLLKNVDVLVFDIQDVGARFYTYISTMVYAMEEASKRGIPFIVLDRPNPITGVHAEGPMLEAGLESFVGCFPMPLRHGMTVGELARMYSGEKNLKLDLEIVAMKGWQRGDWLDSTGVTWVDPSPNLRSLNAALLYPGVAMLEYSRNYSVGRGTDAPFEQVGADWIKGPELAAYLNRRLLPGVRVYPTRFTPTSS
ncbi:MAG: exo-beta-N-acetylmuramidase NamZ domain-containing protein, partial [Bryobacteraceae bacterium]